jgi:hypothetical protein
MSNCKMVMLWLSVYNSHRSNRDNIAGCKSDTIYVCDDLVFILIGVLVVVIVYGKLLSKLLNLTNSTFFELPCLPHPTTWRQTNYMGIHPIISSQRGHAYLDRGFLLITLWPVEKPKLSFSNSTLSRNCLILSKLCIPIRQCLILSIRQWHISTIVDIVVFLLLPISSTSFVL